MKDLLEKYKPRGRSGPKRLLGRDDGDIK